MKKSFLQVFKLSTKFIINLENYKRRRDLGSNRHQKQSFLPSWIYIFGFYLYSILQAFQQQQPFNNKTTKHSIIPSPIQGTEGRLNSRKKINVQQLNAN